MHVFAKPGIAEFVDIGLEVARVIVPQYQEHARVVRTELITQRLKMTAKVRVEEGPRIKLCPAVRGKEVAAEEHCGWPFGLHGLEQCMIPGNTAV